MHHIFILRNYVCSFLLGVANELNSAPDVNSIDRLHFTLDYVCFRTSTECDFPSRITFSFGILFAACPI